MKKITLFLIILAATTTAFSQQVKPSAILTHQVDLRKSKKQKIAAWLLLSSGFVMTTIGADLYAVSENSGVVDPFFTIGGVMPVPDDKNNFTIAGVLFFSGLAGMTGSIPLFKASAQNKKKAISLLFSSQKIPALEKNSFVYHAVPSLNLKISL